MLLSLSSDTWTWFDGSMQGAFEVPLHRNQTVLLDATEATRSWSAATTAHPNPSWCGSTNECGQQEGLPVCARSGEDDHSFVIQTLQWFNSQEGDIKIVNLCPFRASCQTALFQDSELADWRSCCHRWHVHSSGPLLMGSSERVSTYIWILSTQDMLFCLPGLRFLLVLEWRIWKIWNVIYPKRLDLQDIEEEWHNGVRGEHIALQAGWQTPLGVNTVGTATCSWFAGDILPSMWRSTETALWPTPVWSQVCNS